MSHDADDSRTTARAAREAMHNDPRWLRAGGWPVFDTESNASSVDAVLVGLGTHKRSISATGAHATPAAVRHALARFSPHAANTDLGALAIADAGDAAEPDDDEAAATALVREVASRCRLTIAIGGDNSATVAAALGAFGDRIDSAGLITVDAHHDLRDGDNNGSPVQRLIEAGLDGRRVVQIGIQDFANSSEYTDRADEHGITVIRRDEVEDVSMSEIAAQALAVAGAAGGPVHVDIDVDVCDRAVVPACPASVPGGISAWQLRTLVRALTADAAVESIDFTEVDATADTEDGRTVRLVALCVLEALTGLASREPGPSST